MADIEAQDQTQNKTEIISVRLDPLTKEKLAYICDLEYRPMALQIRKIIEDFIRVYESDKGLVPDPNFNVAGDEKYPGFTPPF
jgi:hypothetical protein|nr:MAG TPA: Proline dehydrogenase/DNA Complex, Proline, Utilization, DNA, DNA [Caudoviricetes sp.]DAY06069.1 MAG TPA: Proline dehydrogenase/DNA Complex, Proline, Utilization, DNA, DNA [Caudoviricetes sp.]